VPSGSGSCLGIFMRGDVFITVRQAKLGERERTKPETFYCCPIRDLGFGLVRPRCAASRKRVLRGRRRRRLRSVDSEWAGRVIEPRNILVAVADVVVIAEGNSRGAKSRDTSRTACALAPPGSKSTARPQWAAQELGRSSDASSPSTTAAKRAKSIASGASKEVGVPRRSCEPGEPTPRDPGEQRRY
jgi:hypothetical protein